MPEGVLMDAVLVWSYEGSPPDTGPATATTSAIGAAEGGEGCQLSPQTFVVGAGAGAGVGVDEGSPLDTGPATATTSAIGAAEGSPSATTT
ncbi:hypothetical protein V6N13_013531 [Hibiscus sabdariffa]